jgi:hypothetical protein
MIHPWMTGQVNVQRGGTIIGQPEVTLPKDTTPPKMLKPKDIEIDAENQSGARVTFEVLTIDDTDQIIRPSCSPSSGSMFSVGTTIVTCNASDSAGNKASPVSFTVTVNPTESVIPSWVKNIASFWCADSIDDGSFVEGIQYLIDNNIIVVSSVQSGNTESQGIPDWVKNNACWWSENLISDGDFASGIQFLVQSGIIVVDKSEPTLTTSSPPPQSSDYFTEEEIVEIMSDVSFYYRYTSLENRSVSEDNGLTIISYQLTNDEGERVGVVSLHKSGPEVKSLAIGTHYEVTEDSLTDAMWLLTEAEGTIISTDEWKEATDTTVLLWIMESLKSGSEKNSVTVGDYTITLINNYDGVSDGGTLVLVINF